MWMACYTQEEIAEREGVTQQAMDAILQGSADLSFLVKSDQAAAEPCHRLRGAALQRMEAAADFRSASISYKMA